MIDITTLIAIVATLFTGAAWIVSRLDKITAELAAMRTNAKDYVTHEICHRRRLEIEEKIFDVGKVKEIAKEVVERDLLRRQLK